MRRRQNVPWADDGARTEDFLAVDPCFPLQSDHPRKCRGIAEFCASINLKFHQTNTKNKKAKNFDK